MRRWSAASRVGCRRRSDICEVRAAEMGLGGGRRGALCARSLVWISLKVAIVAVLWDLSRMCLAYI